MTEAWKDIEGYEGLYQVSNFGRVKSLDRVVECKNGSRRLYKGKQLASREDGCGYLLVNLWKDGTQKSVNIHKLVAEAFIPNPENKPTVDHINRDRKDNCAENLRWATWLEQADNRGGATAKKPVIAIKGDTILCFESAKQAEKYGFDSRNIYACCRGIYKTHHGYEWHYLGNWLDKQTPDTPAPYVLARNISASLQ